MAGGEVSARPDRLSDWVEAAQDIRVQLANRIQTLTASYYSFNGSSGIQVGNPDLTDSAIPDFLGGWQNDEVFTEAVAQAFRDADAGGLGTRGPDGTISVPSDLFDGQFENTARSLGLDPAALLAARVPITVDDPIAGGVPRTSGFVADPVCTATGHLVEVEDDLVMPARLAALTFRRTYSSRFVGEGPLGRGWACWASAALIHGDGGSLGYHGPDGQLAVLPPSPTGGWISPSGLLATAEAADEGAVVLVWQLHSSRPGQRWTFDADGLLRSVAGPTIGTTELDYDRGLLVRLRHDGGRSVRLRWDGARIEAIESSDGRRVTYRYNDAGDLVSVDRAAGACRYEPDDRGRLVEVHDADGVRLCRNTFDDDGRVLTQVSPYGRETVFRYEPGRRTVVADTEGGPASTFEHDPAGRLVALVGDDGRRMARSFDAEGRTLAAAGFDGARTVNRYDGDGRLVALESPAGVESWEYDDDGRVAAHVAAGGRVLRFDYDDGSLTPSRAAGPEGWSVSFERDERGQLRRVEDADGVAVELDHDAEGNLTVSTNGVGATTRFRYHPSGQPTEIVAGDGTVVTIDVDDAGHPLAVRAPTGDTWRIEWSPAGRLLATVDPDGSRTEFAYASHGGIDRITDPAGSSVELVHDHLQRLVRILCADGAKWELDHTALGQLAAVADPTGAVWRYAYDPEGRLTEATDPLGTVVHARYDRAGRVVATTDRTGATTTIDRDEAGDLRSIADPTGAATTIDRDGWGRPTAVVDADGVTTRTTYTPAGRIAAVRSGEDRGQDYAYDAAGRVVTVTELGGGATRYEWDACDRLVRIARPSGRTIEHTYDAMGRCVATRRGRSRWTMAYDAIGRVVAVTDPLGATTRYAYDGRGKLAAATDPNGGAVHFRRDVRGDVIAVVDQRGSTWATRYDAARRAIATTDPLGRTTSIARDLAGRVGGIAMPNGTHVDFGRDGEGRVTDVAVDGRDVVAFVRDRNGRPTLVHEPAPNRTQTLTWTPGGRLAALDRDGVTLTWQHDADGLVTERTTSTGRTTRYAYDAGGRVVAVEDSATGGLRFERDADGRTVALRQPVDGIERRWEHDDAGLVVAYVETTPAGERRAVLRRDAVGRVIAVDAADGGRSYSYDDAGQLVAAVLPSGAWRWVYDETGRLVTEDGPAGRRTFTYDDAHELVRVDAPDGATQVAYDATGRRIAEDGPGGTVHYEWDGLGRLRAVERGGRRTEFDVDGLGQLAGVDGVPIVWDPTGPLPALVSVGAAPVGDPATAGGHADLVGRDPWAAPAAPGGPSVGALGELEAGGLVWLQARAYDPATRQFLSPDPLPGVPGAAVAANPYHYAGNDPIGFVDPLGLQPISIDQYNDIRRQETGVQWGNIAIVGLTVASFFVPGGPIVATLVGAGLGMAPDIIHGIQTGDWDVGRIVRGGVLGALGGRFGYAMGAGSTGLTSAIMRGSFAGGVTGLTTEALDVVPFIPGGDGSFDPERVALEAAIGGMGGGIGYRMHPPTRPTDFGEARFVVDSNGVTTDLGPRFYSGARPIVIGEGMGDRVIPAARDMAADWYQPPRLSDAASMAHNRYWINEQMNQGRGIIDIGPAPGRANYPEPTSPWYAMERSEIAGRDYPWYTSMPRP